MRTKAAHLEDEDVDAFLTATAESSLICYVEQAWEYVDTAPYIANWHVELMCEELQAFVDGHVAEEDLLINVPPGCMKSILVGVMLPTWAWGPANRPDTRWFFSSYSSELTTRDSLKRRYLMNSPWYQARWGSRFTMTTDQDRKTRFMNDKGGDMMASSVGGAVLGEHPDYLITDDPQKPDEAESDVESQNVRDWWDASLSTRGRIRKSKRITIMQRLKENDLSGHMLSRGGVRHICLPMRYEPDHPFRCDKDPRKTPGQLLWPQAFNDSLVKDLESRLGSHKAAGQLQQRPTPAGGGLFKREWFSYYRDAGDHYEVIQKAGGVRRVLKADCWRFISCDLALTTKTYNDFSVYQVWDVERAGRVDPATGQTLPSGTMFLVEQWRDRKEAPYVEDELRAAVHRWKPLFIGVEDNSNFDTSVIQRFRRDGLPVRAVTPDKDKVTRAMTASVWMENGKVAFPVGAPWLSALEAELMTFPQCDHDDAVDTLAYACIFANNKDLWEKPKAKELPPGSIGKILGHDRIINPTPPSKKAFALGRGR